MDRWSMGDPQGIQAPLQDTVLAEYKIHICRTLKNCKTHKVKYIVNSGQ